jgi:uncharacterized protein (TIGR03437 family)
MHVEGSRILDSTGQGVVLRGGEIPGLDRPALTPDLQIALSPPTFSSMRQRFNMNALRLPVSITNFESDPLFLTRVATVVRQANAVGLVVILAETGDGDLTGFWRAVASLFAANPMMIFDAYNEPQGEPHGSDWNAWRNSMQGLVDVIRSTGATQIIAVQGFTDVPEFQGFNAFLIDPNIVYEVHPWFYKDLTDADREAHFGFLADRVPVFAGQWGFVPGQDSANCRALPSDPHAAEEIILDTLAYFDRRGISWTYSTFLPGDLYIDFADYPRTDLISSWTCNGSTTPGLGIGEPVQYYMDGLTEGDIVPVSGAAGNVVGLARGAVAHIYGYDADQIASVSGPPTTKLGGISVQITDSAGAVMLAPLLCVSPYLVNIVVPENAALGWAQFQIIGGSNNGRRGHALIQDVQPGIFTGPATGRGAAIGIAEGNPIWTCADECSTVPISRDAATVTLIMSGIRNARGQVTATIGGFDVPAIHWGIQDEAGGIDEVDLAIPSQVRGSGETDVLVFVDGLPSNAAKINIK